MQLGNCRNNFSMIGVKAGLQAILWKCSGRLASGRSPGKNCFLTREPLLLEKDRLDRHSEATVLES